MGDDKVGFSLALAGYHGQRSARPSLLSGGEFALGLTYRTEGSDTVHAVEAGVGVTDLEVGDTQMEYSLKYRMVTSGVGRFRYILQPGIRLNTGFDEKAERDDLGEGTCMATGSGECVRTGRSYVDLMIEPLNGGIGIGLGKRKGGLDRFGIIWVGARVGVGMTKLGGPSETAKFVALLGAELGYLVMF